MTGEVRVRISTGAEIRDPGRYCTYLVHEDVEGYVRNHPWLSDVVSVPDTDDAGRALTRQVADAKREAERSMGSALAWTDIDRAGVDASVDVYGGWTAASAPLPAPAVN